MDNLHNLIGQGENLTPTQMAIRAVIAFFITIILIRLGGVRIFGKKSAFDTIVMITMGSVLARGIVGASPFLSVIAAAAAMILIHRLLGWLSFKSRKFEWLLKGTHTVLYQHGKILWKNLEKTSLSEQDLHESLRLETKEDSLENIHTAYMETNGRISFIKKENITGGESGM
jgi:uncharacterized membrane protein YcaP (DUF421 family)